MKKEYRTGNFDATIIFRITHDQKKAIEKIVKYKDDTYYNVSHFVSCAVIKQIRQEDEQNMLHSRALRIQRKK